MVVRPRWFLVVASLGLFVVPLALVRPAASRAPANGELGYYRYPAIHGDTIVFTSEGDLWRVGVAGGLAQRLTTAPGQEDHAAISPDGTTIAFSATYEGPREVYTMPLAGGPPTRCSFLGDANVAGWTPDGKILFSTSHFSTLPARQLCTCDPRTMTEKRVPLYQAADGTYSADGKTLFFTRIPFQGSQTKRYQGGEVQNLWKFADGDKEATPLTTDFKGTSKEPMFWNGRVYFASDRDGVMNIWSMTPDGKDLKQHTHYTNYDVQSPRLDAGRIVYQQGADIRLLDLATGKEGIVPIRLASDFDQTREKWVTNPKDWVTSAALSPDGKRIALTVRGQVFIAPVKSGRLTEVTRNRNVRYRNAKFLPDGKNLVALSDESGEIELWKLPATGDMSAPGEQLTRDGQVFRWDSLPSPDGKYIAHNDKNQRLWLYDVAAKTNKLVASSEQGDLGDLTWSPDSRYLAYTETAENTNDQIKLYPVETGKTITATTDRFSSSSPAFSPDGKYLYFLSQRRLQSSVGSPWGRRQPEPYFDKQTQVYWLALMPGLRSPFQPDDEVTEETKAAAKPDEKKSDEKKSDEKKPDDKPHVEIAEEGLTGRIGLVPVPAGNYYALDTAGKRLFFISAVSGSPSSLVSVEVKTENVKLDTVQENVGGYDISADRKKMLAFINGDYYVFDASGARPNLPESRVNLDGWTFSLQPREEWREMFNEAWRLHRDYLYDPGLHNVNWPAMREKYRPLVDRVADRSELSDVLAQMVGEISVLHTFVYGGDGRGGNENIGLAGLGAVWERDAAAGGYRITRIYKSDPDEPQAVGPLLQPGVGVKEGDVIERINGIPVATMSDAESLLRAQAGRQVRLRILPGGDRAKAREVIVTPISAGSEFDLRYRDWEYSRRMAVEKASSGTIGYVHLRAMGSGDIATWYRDYYPVFNRQGLIVDVRHNNGGNIDSWILEKLLRKAWMYWKPRVGAPTWNMQYAFRGPIVVLCDESTASDGEAFTEGFRRLGLGKVIGTRTWGGEVWLSSDNVLVDRGIATAAETGVYGPEGKWLIEGEGVIPDITVDNLPHAAYNGQDAQLDAAIKYLQDEIKKHPNPVPANPKYPDKSFPPRGKTAPPPK